MEAGYWWKEPWMLHTEFGAKKKRKTAKLSFPKCPNFKHFVVSLTLIQQSHCGAERQTVCVGLMLTFHRDNSSAIGTVTAPMITTSLQHRLYDFLTQLHK